MLYMWRIKQLLCLLLCACLLTACAVQPATTDPVSVEFATKPEKDYKTIFVIPSDFTLVEQTNASFVYTDAKPLTCEYSKAILVNEVKFSDGDTFQKGDIIATFRFDVSQSELLRMELAYQQAVTNRDNQLASYENKIAQYTKAAAAEGTAGQIAALQLEQARNDLKLYEAKVSDSLQTQWEAIEEYRDRFSTKMLIAPEDGMVIGSVSLKADTVLNEGATLLTYTTGSSKLLALASVNSNFLSMASPGTRVAIGRGDQEILGEVVASPVGIDDKLDNNSIYISSPFFDQLESRSYYSVFCTLLDLRDLLILDKKVLHYDDDGNPYVMVLENDVAVKQEVVCGVEYRGSVCILDGLTAGQYVITNY